VPPQRSRIQHESNRFSTARQIAQDTTTADSRFSPDCSCVSIHRYSLRGSALSPGPGCVVLDVDVPRCYLSNNSAGYDESVPKRRHRTHQKSLLCYPSSRGYEVLPFYLSRIRFSLLDLIRSKSTENHRLYLCRVEKEVPSRARILRQARSQLAP